MVKLSHFGRILWCTFTQMLNENKYKFTFLGNKSWVASIYTAYQTKTAKKKKGTFKKALQTLYGQKTI